MENMGRCYLDYINFSRCGGNSIKLFMLRQTSLDIPGALCQIMGFEIYWPAGYP